MKKIILLAVFALVVGLFVPVQPEAHAASVVDTILAQAVNQNPSVAKLQELLQAKAAFDQGNKDALRGMVVQTAAQKFCDGDLAPIAASIACGGNVNDVVKNTLNQEINRRYGEKLGKYQDGLGVILSLLNNSGLYPKVSQDNNNLLVPPADYREVMQMTATAYGPGYEDNGKWGNQTYMGGLVRKGVAAVDPNVIPLGSKLWIEGYGPAIAEDEGSAIVGKRIDLAFNDRQEALDYGIKPVKVYVLN